MTDTDLLICVKRVDLLRRFALSGCFLVVGDKPAIPHASSARQVASSGIVSRQSLQQQRVPPRLGRSAVRPICFSSLNDIRRASVGEMSRREKKLPPVGRARMHQNVGHFPSPPRHLPPAGYRRDPSQLIAGRLQTLTEDVHFYSMLLLTLFLLRL